MSGKLKPDYLREIKQRFSEHSAIIKNAPVLIVDDDEEFRSLFKVYLTNLGCKRVLEAENGRNALKIIRTSRDKPQMVYLDVNMPFDGIECCRVLRKDQILKELDVHLVIITSDRQAKTEVLRFNSGANNLLRKPIQFKDVFLSVLVYFQAEIERQVRLGALGSQPVPNNGSCL